jgi:taurine--2-oxoglutarate transaminase
LTGDPRRWPNDTGTSGVVHFFGPFLYRSVYHATTQEEERDRALENLENTIQFEGPSAFAAIILETIPGTAGIMVPPPGFLAGVREICDRYGIVYIADEVMCGFGRTGSWFAYQHHDVKPDLVTFAKGVNSGYVPLGGVVIDEAISATFNDRVYPGGLTYSGHPLACAAAVASIEAMESEHIIENAKRIGDEVLRPGLEALAAKHQVIGDVRGLGVFFALEFVTDRATKEPLAP